MKKKWIRRMLKTLLSSFVLILTFYVLWSLEYVSQLRYVDNWIGIMPVLLALLFCCMTLVLIWKKYQNRVTASAVLFLLDGILVLLFVIACTGNWFPLGSPLDTAGLQAPSAEVMATESLPVPSETEIEGQSPKLDGATALYPLYRSFAEAVYADDADLEEYLFCSNTAGAYEAIIKNECDIAFVAEPSAKQRKKAEQAGANLVYTPIGKEAFVFMVGKENPVSQLSYQQIKNIYSGKTAYWETLGWPGGGKIIAFQRPEGSGSQTGLQKVMGNLPIHRARPLLDDRLAGNGRLTEQISVRWQGIQPAIGYSYRYYATKMYPNENVKLLTVDGVYPFVENIAADQYKFSSNFYAVTNGEPKGNTEKLIEWILSEEGQYLIEKVGYVPLSK